MVTYSFNAVDLQSPFFQDEGDKVALYSVAGLLLITFSKARGLYTIEKSQESTLVISGNGVYVSITSDDIGLIDSEFTNFRKWTNEAQPVTGGGGGAGDASAANQLTQIVAEQSIDNKLTTTNSSLTTVNGNLTTINSSVGTSNTRLSSIDSKLTTITNNQTNATQVVKQRSTTIGYALLTNVVAQIGGAGNSINTLTITNTNGALRQVKIYSSVAIPLITSAVGLIGSYLIGSICTLQLNFPSGLQLSAANNLWVCAVAGTTETDATNPGTPLRLTYGLN
jgi:hypothetical protein